MQVIHDGFATNAYINFMNSANYKNVFLDLHMYADVATVATLCSGRLNFDGANSRGAATTALWRRCRR
jgi:hypothetical protein